MFSMYNRYVIKMKSNKFIYITCLVPESQAPFSLGLDDVVCQMSKILIYL